MLDKILAIYNRLLLKLFKAKLFCVDYQKFMNSQHKKNCGVLSKEKIRKSSKKLISITCFTTFFLTFLATLPTNIFISLPCALLDFIQFQIFLNIIEQQILYLYGTNDLRNKEGFIDEKNGAYLLWLQTELMLGINGSITNKLKSAGSFVLRKSISLVFAKSPFRLVMMSFLRQFLKWCGVVATHELVVSSLEIFIIVLCALIAATVSLWQFSPMCKRFFQNINFNGAEFYENKFLQLEDKK
ncbi:MAG: hypothetical protein IJ150_03780 [Bacteroidales bacterium]|nr:hypothetical protein [Bacteroidales bacterium]